MSSRNFGRLRLTVGNPLLFLVTGSSSEASSPEDSFLLFLGAGPRLAGVEFLPLALLLFLATG